MVDGALTPWHTKWGVLIGTTGAREVVVVNHMGIYSVGIQPCVCVKDDGEAVNYNMSTDLFLCFIGNITSVVCPSLPTCFFRRQLSRLRFGSQI